MNKHTLAVILVFSLLSFQGCKAKREPEGYRVVSYDGATQQWTIIRTETINGEHLRKRLIVGCLLYQKGKDDMRDGPNACELQVGRTLVPNLHPTGVNRATYMNVEQLGTGFYIAEGWGDDLVSQQFKIIKESLLSTQ
jgi:hypothetical protein